MSKKMAIYVDEETHKNLSRWAKRRKMEVGSAAERLVHVAIGRQAALDKYNAKTRKGDAKAAS